MKAFAQLFQALDETNKTNEKVAVLKDYFVRVPDDDKMNMLALFTGRRPKRPINSTLVRTYALEASNIPAWLFEESYHVVGDLAETMSLLMPEAEGSSNKTLTEWIGEINDIAKRTEEERKQWLISSWAMLDRQERFVFNKILTGSFRIGVSTNLVIKALADVTELTASVLTHRLMGSWMPNTYTYAQLTQEQADEDDISRPYPFFLAYPIQETSTVQKSTEELQTALGDATDWQAEWKWDGIRAQLIKRRGEIFIWSRGEDLATEKFPELHPFLNELPDGTVLDGEILSFADGLPLPFGILQTRIGRKNLSKKILADSPVALIVYDCLEYNGEDIRPKTQSERREILEGLQAKTSYPDIFRISPLITFNTWDELAEVRSRSREMVAEGIMLKRKSANYQVGRRRGDWWKWKIDPLSVDAVMIYAQKGHGRRADLYTDYTFAVWDGDKLVPFAKAYSGLTDAEINKVDYFIKRNTLEKFGPVRTVKPELVFEIGFEGINKSNRHKSGVALRFPRILRWRQDKPKEEADTIESLKALLGE
ncbi:ATP-dependent DNA ligase [Mucilaginibacter myungsuensis]|uniref:DNA ligase (ATP) n=1 Tax=Mucilaginibacter myungsuensis TaxID=649104 RepID=A0A929PVE6_9SPHI|nr:ATP-dependent DNA ligase [Mucilaginibacter myungsuensis]MBE9661054.1 ATP-dependent DNA ligase [Mucilaginibacter myungsuensis]MDN3597198.1 ATP-dependent DNA ligase [Mucilaginibacter myungsuensis]